MNKNTTIGIYLTNFVLVLYFFIVSRQYKELKKDINKDNKDKNKIISLFQNNDIVGKKICILIMTKKKIYIWNLRQKKLLMP
jgi:hypothetical protein